MKILNLWHNTLEMKIKIIHNDFTYAFFQSVEDLMELARYCLFKSILISSVAVSLIGHGCFEVFLCISQ